MAMPASEFDVDVSLVARLLASQYPELSALEIRKVGSGWDNSIFRLGSTLALRLPRRNVAGIAIRNEQIWLPLLEKRLPLKIPTPIRVGQPYGKYPWYWSVVPWLNGETADVAFLDQNQGQVLGSFFEALHRAAPANAPKNPFRGGSLFERENLFLKRITTLIQKNEPVIEDIMSIWHNGLSVPIDVPSTWIHGDPHPLNVLATNGTITSIIDWGDMGQGDRAADLAAIWMLFPDRAMRQSSIAECASVTEATWRRAKAWAVFYAVLFKTAGLSGDQRMARIAEGIFRNLLEDTYS